MWARMSLAPESISSDTFETREDDDWQETPSLRTSTRLAYCFVIFGRSHTLKNIAMADRRRINGPTGTTLPPVFAEAPSQAPRKNAEDGSRKICE